MSSTNSINNDFRDTLDLILSKWKIILATTILALIIAFVYLRYATYEYQATASIKIANKEESSSKLPEISAMQNYGLFSSDFSNIDDEIELLKSRAILRKVVDELDLNIRYFELGRIKETELYKNPPVKINFFENDSVINQIDTTLYLKINSSTKFSLSSIETNKLLDLEDKNAKIYSFGDKIKTGFGDIVITPNSFKEDSLKIGSNIKLKLISLDKIVDKYRTKINVVNAMGSNIVLLSVNENLKEKAKLILDKLIEKYNEDVANDKAKSVKATSDFINNRLNLVSQELEQVDYTAEDLQKRNNLTALNSQADLNLESKSRLQTQISNTTNNIQLISFLEEELTSKNRNSDNLPADIGIGDSNTSQLIKTHNELVAQRDRVLRNSSEKNPVVIQLNNQITSLKSSLRTSLKSIKQTSELTLNNLNRDNARIRGQLFSAPTKARQFRDIKRQQDIKESLYLYLLEKREESAIQQGLSFSNAKIIDMAYTESIPISPKKSFIYVAALVLGMMLPIIFIYLTNLLDTAIHNKKDLTKVLNIPYLGDIPKSSKKTKLIKKVDYSSKAEAFRIVRSNLDFILTNVNGKPKKIFITSTKAQEGKSHTSANLASSISFSEKSVLLIEMDIRMPKILSYLKLKDKPEIGLSDYIADKSIKPQDIIVKHPDNKFLDIIPSGTIPPNPSELLMNDRVEELFNYFENKYDYIIADTSAVGLVSDTLLISKFADMFIYVISADGVDNRQVANVQTLHDEKRLPNMTMLLNGVKSGKGGYGYGYGYGNNPNRKRKWYQFSKSK